MNELEKIIKEYLPEITDINQSETVEILPLTIADMMIEYHESKVKNLSLSDVSNSCEPSGLLIPKDKFKIKCKIKSIKKMPPSNCC